jgi:hypothetical protein
MKTSVNRTFSLILPLASLLISAMPLAAAFAADAPPQVRLEPSAEEPSAVFRWSTDACEGWDVPDTAARAFRDAEGRVHVIASHHVNRALVGPDLDHLKHDCRVLFRGRQSDEPQAFDDKAWLSGLFTPDGQTVFALVHNEFQGNQRSWLCPSREYMRCWRNSVTFAVSRDGGFTFSEPEPPGQLVATPPRPYEGDIGRHVGYFNPSNIIEKDGYYYVFFSASEYGAQQGGACLMRTKTLEDPRSWRGWDGRDFTVRFIDPYRERVDDEKRHVCAPVGRGRLLTPVSGVVRHEPSGLYLMTMAGVRKPAPDAEPVSGFYVAASRDLITWSEPTLAWKAQVYPRRGACDSVLANYPSLIDPASTSRNFETVGDAPMMYFVRNTLHDCKPGQDRDLVRQRVRIRVGG